jgi:ketosteroid isomerase-like protein
VNRSDWDAFFRDMHPDVELTTRRGPTAGTHRRREAVQGFIEDYSATFETVLSVPERFLENGDQVLALVTRRARPKGGDVDIEVRNGHLWRVRDGTILSMKSSPTKDEALNPWGCRSRVLTSLTHQLWPRCARSYSSGGQKAAFSARIPGNRA